MTRGSDKPFVQGKPFKYLDPSSRASDSPRGRRCTKCQIYRSNNYFEDRVADCNVCKKKVRDYESRR